MKIKTVETILMAAQSNQHGVIKTHNNDVYKQ